jgi:CHRD domain/PEP-CTERM motif
MKKLSITLLLLALPCLGWGQLVYNISAMLEPTQEVPARPSMGSGMGWGTLNADTNWLDFNVTFSGLTSPQTAAHFHSPGPPGVNAPVEIPLPLGSPIHFMGTLTDLEESQLLSGLFYVNVHTTMFPGGEIRGQLVVGSAVPEPSTYGLFGAAALVGLVAYRRRSAKAKLIA